jgi:hypothetical protein
MVLAKSNDLIQARRLLRHRDLSTLGHEQSRKAGLSSVVRSHAPFWLDDAWPGLPDREQEAFQTNKVAEKHAWGALPPSDRLISQLHDWWSAPGFCGVVHVSADRCRPWRRSVSLRAPTSPVARDKLSSSPVTRLPLAPSHYAHATIEVLMASLGCGFVNVLWQKGPASLVSMSGGLPFCPCGRVLAAQNSRATGLKTPLSTMQLHGISNAQARGWSLDAACGMLDAGAVGRGRDLVMLVETMDKDILVGDLLG